VSLEKSGSNLQGYTRYNWQVATGKASTPFDAPVVIREAPAEGVAPVDLPDPEDIFLDYDRRHRFITNLRYFVPSGSGIELLGLHPFGNMSFSATYRYQSGRPYTYDPTGQGLKFNKRAPDNHDLRLRIQKRFQAELASYTVYVEGFNILNEKEYAHWLIFNNEYYADRWNNNRDLILLNDDQGDSGPYGFYDSVRRISNEPRYFRVGLILDF
jgi:hypothetical protein